MHIDANVMVPVHLWLAGVEAHAHPYLASFRPGLKGQGLLRLDSGGDGVAGAGEGDEEGVALGVDFNAGVLSENFA